MGNEQDARQIIFYDGFCPMCNGWVRRLLRWDRHGRFHFAPLEGEAANRILAPVMPDYREVDTIIYYHQGEVSIRSTAALNILSGLGGIFRVVAGAGRLIPRAWRDWVYKMIAARRYRFGPRYAACPMPPQEHRARFMW